MSNSTWTLWYWARGTPLSITSIEASPEANVDTLKKRIFESRPGLQGDPVDANLYKIPEAHQLPAVGKCERDIGALSISHLGQPLRTTQKLNHIFAPHPKDDQLHLILDVPTLSIQCWIRGAGNEQYVIVEVSKFHKLGHLREAIKNKRVPPTDIPMNQLKLYKISTMDDELGGILADRGVGQLLDGAQLLQTFFDDVSFSTYPRVVVEWLEEASSVPRAMLCLNCLVLGDTRDHIFSVKIASSENVSLLRKAIKQEKQYVFPADQLTLYRTSLPNDSELKNKLESLNFDESLQPTSVLANVFPNPPMEEYVHIIIIVERGHAKEQIPVLLEERIAYLVPKPSAPSSGAATFEMTQLQGCVYLCHRPPKAADPVPVTLIEPVFAKFVDDCQMYTPTDKDYHFVRKLSCKMSEFYANKSQRMEQFRELFSSHVIKVEAGTIGSSKYLTDGHSTVEKFVVVIVEGKNEIGTGGCDPFAQALFYYHHFIRNVDANMCNVARHRSAFPCFHVIVFGAYIGIVGSVFTRKIQSEVLVPIIPLCWHSKQVAMQDMAARTFGALRIAINKLKEIYSKPIPFLEYPDFHLDCPSWQQYTDAHNNSQQFIYEESQKLRERLIFFGKLKSDPSRRICIKFVTRYSADAHRFCASKGHAPELIAFEKLPGGWYMVIMEALDITEGPSTRADSYRCFRDHRHRVPGLTTLEVAVTTLICDFHRENYVHGDLRDVNLFVRDGGPGKTTHFVLLDFDWAGKVHETYYPPHVNRKEIDRPSGARDGKEILMAHDLEMLRSLFHPRPDTTSVVRGISMMSIREESDVSA